MSLRHLFNPFSDDLGVDPGTANTTIYARGRGVAYEQAVRVAGNEMDEAIIHRVEQVGRARSLASLFGPVNPTEPAGAQTSATITGLQVIVSRRFGLIENLLDL